MSRFVPYLSSFSVVITACLRWQFIKERNFILSCGSGSCEIPKHGVHKGFELPQEVEGQVGTCGGIKPQWALIFHYLESPNLCNVL